MSNITTNIKNIQQQLFGRQVLLLAVSKSQNPVAIQQAIAAGLTNFAENYLQEAIPKIEALHAYPCTWHYIGQIQQNKCKKIAQYFTWVHTIDRLDIAKKLNDANQHLQRVQQICIQVNLFNEPQKGGVSVDNLLNLLIMIQSLPFLKCRGLMTILPKELSTDEQLHAYQHLAHLQTQINQTYHLHLDTLSMGMSQDYLQAIAAGSTIIRIGQGIFGTRSTKDSYK